MTHPNLLRLTRWCAKWAGGVLFLGTLTGALPAGNGGMVSRAPKPPPSPLPAAVTDLHAQAISDSAIVLTWTEISSGSTSVPRYLVRFDSLGKFDWTTESDVLTGNCAAPIVATRAAGGRPRACVITGLQPNVAYQFQMVAYTGTLNSTAVFGPLSNIADAKTAQRLGPLLLWRPGMSMLDSVTVQAVDVTDWLPMRFPLRGTFRFGDRVARFYDSTGAVAAIGYVVVVKPN